MNDILNEGWRRYFQRRKLIMTMAFQISQNVNFSSYGRLLPSYVLQTGSLFGEFLMKLFFMFDKLSVIAVQMLSKYSQWNIAVLMFNIPKHKAIQSRVREHNNCLAIVTKTSHPPPNETGLACVELHGPEFKRRSKWSRNQNSLICTCEFLRRERQPEENISRAWTVMPPRFFYYLSLMAKRY